MNTWLLDAIRAKQATNEWGEVTSTHAGHTATFRLSADALIINGIRETFSARQAQQAATALGALLPTPKLLDLRYAQATVRCDPQTIGGNVTDTQRQSRTATLDHSKKIGAIVGNQQGIVQNVGKHWVLDARSTHERATLYGWHVPTHKNQKWEDVHVYPSASDPSLWVIQQPCQAHDYDYVDYSMTLVLIDEQCLLDGQPDRTSRLLADPALCALLVASGGPLKAVLPIGG